MLDAVLAAAMASVAALALLTVSTSLMSHARTAGSAQRGRAVAEQIAAQADSARCATQTGAEPAAALTAQRTACATALGTTTPATVGDLSFETTSGGLDYSVSISTRWLRRADRAIDATSCATLASSPPVAMERTVRVSRTSAVPTPDIYEYSTVRPAAPDDALHQSTTGAIVVAGLLADDVVLLTADGSGIALRRTASLLSSGTGCAWFPFLPDGDYTVELEGASTTNATVANRELRIVDRAALVTP